MNLHAYEYVYAWIDVPIVGIKYFGPILWGGVKLLYPNWGVKNVHAFYWDTCSSCTT